MKRSKIVSYVPEHAKAEQDSYSRFSAYVSEYLYYTYVPVSTPWLPNGITTPQILVVSGPVVEQIGGLDLFFILFFKKWVAAAVKKSTCRWLWFPEGA